MSLGEKLIALRKESGMSQEAVAEKLGVSRQTISKWETDLTLILFVKKVIYLMWQTWIAWLMKLIGAVRGAKNIPF